MYRPVCKVMVRMCAVIKWSTECCSWAWELLIKVWMSGWVHACLCTAGITLTKASVLITHKFKFLCLIINSYSLLCPLGLCFIRICHHSLHVFPLLLCEPASSQPLVFLTPHSSVQLWCSCPSSSPPCYPCFWNCPFADITNDLLTVNSKEHFSALI